MGMSMRFNGRRADFCYAVENFCAMSLLKLVQNNFNHSFDNYFEFSVSIYGPLCIKWTEAQH